MKGKVLGFRLPNDLQEAFEEKRTVSNLSETDALCEAVRYWVEVKDNRIPENVVPFRCKTATRIVDGKSLNTVALRDDPLGTMYHAGQLNGMQYDIGRAVEWHFTKWHGNQGRSNFPTKTRVDTSLKLDCKITFERFDPTPIPTNDDVQQAREFLRQARETLGYTAYQLVADVIYNKKPTLKAKQFAAALDKLAPLCGYATERKAA